MVSSSSWKKGMIRLPTRAGGTGPSFPWGHNGLQVNPYRAHVKLVTREVSVLGHFMSIYQVLVVIHAPVVIHAILVGW